MNALAVLLLTFFLGGIILYFAYKAAKWLGDILLAVINFGAAAYFFTSVKIDSFVNLTLAGFHLSWGITGFAWIFAVLLAILVPLVMLYSIPYMKGKDRLGWFYMLVMFSVGAMYGILMARDWISLFFFWEIMSWSSYLLILYNKNINPDKVGLKYVLFSAIGAYAMLTAIVAINHYVGSLYIHDLFSAFAGLSLSIKLMIGLLLITGFAVKAAMMPLHIWAPDAYSSTPMSYTAIFSGALSKMGVYGIGLVIINLYVHSGIRIVGDVLAWIAAFTAVIATYYAIIQDDAKKLLAWSSVAQLGYIVGGLAIGTKLSVFAGIYLALLHGLFKANLFMAIGAVEQQTGTTKFSDLRALIRKMPWTFFAALISIIALAGIPPLSGFVGKWMLYESMITSGHFVVVVLFFLSSVAAFLYSFRFLFGVFLGQEEKDYDNVREANPLMVIPMILLALFLIVAGLFPGIMFGPIAKSMAYLGFDNVNYQMSILTNEWGQSVNMIAVGSSLVIVFVLFLIIITIVAHRRSRNVSTKDIHTAGEPPSEEDNYHFSEHFYRPFQRAFSFIYRYAITPVYQEIARAVEDFFQYVRRFYTGNAQTYAIYVLVFLALLFLIAKNIF